MTRRTNARIAGFTYLLYIAFAFPSMVVFGKATKADGIAAKLAGIAQYTTDLHVTAVLSLLGCFAALVLAVTLYAITREQDPDLAMLGLTFRVGEGVTGAISIQRTMGLLWLATAAGANAPSTEGANTLGTYLLSGEGSNTIGATFFAVGSTFFSYLLLRGRMIPAPLAWLGVVASVLLVVGLPLQLAGFLRGSVAGLLWLPMAAFEIPLGLWLIIKGAAMPGQGQAT